MIKILLTVFINKALVKNEFYNICFYSRLFHNPLSIPTIGQDAVASFVTKYHWTFPNATAFSCHPQGKLCQCFLKP